MPLGQPRHHGGSPKAILSRPRPGARVGRGGDHLPIPKVLSYVNLNPAPLQMQRGQDGGAASSPRGFLADLTSGPEVLDCVDPVTLEAVAADHGPLAPRAADVQAVALGRLSLVVGRDVVPHDVADGRDAVKSLNPNAVATIDFVRAVGDPIFLNPIMVSAVDENPVPACLIDAIASDDVVGRFLVLLSRGARRVDRPDAGAADVADAAAGDSIVV